MRIAFDLDDLLIPSQFSFPTSSLSIWQKALRLENLREGTCHLFSELKKQDHEIWVYTSSLRTRSHIFKTFLFQGMVLDGIVNYQKHQTSVPVEFKNLSKHPPSFGIHLMIDDRPVIQLDGQQFDFEVLCISPHELLWTHKVLETTAQLMKLH
ncbi:MAG: hypothetical protein ACFB10_19630 [Salibacteraceae bacterium]